MKMINTVSLFDVPWLKCEKVVNLVNFYFTILKIA